MDKYINQPANFHTAKRYSTCSSPLPVARISQSSTLNRSGEQAGHLDVVLEKLADYVEEQNVLRKSIMLASVYPVILVLIALSVVTYLLQSVVPDILDVFISSNRELPGPTQMLLNFTGFLR